ncbi:Uncharacterised protein [Mycobacteroides abscessus subsp. abscessus]|uniref:hypothetical protein n=1 Tax=Mycobacteroides abscessus TaxID=36809 RepID=UPI0009A90AB7|nr:hypothetical protein [Mycobacteroides abscessus]SLD05590.1 Uncharacterised protein [Mycobacteroides abscessus subsp. abscessus]SLH60056.1 Uncharacterised protein [Mycobacteroides abscessus subsp. abscessus]SLH80686.1 Uncharacterised protein [Mycobacteroides abscessus subsp. abscessus]
MSPQSDVQKPKDDQFHLIQDSWPSESESSYAAAEVMADDTAALTSSQAESAMDAAAKTAEGMRGKTADSVGGGYDTAATQLHTQSVAYGTIAGWMTDAAGKVRTAKRQIAALVRSGTQEIRDALESETKGTPVNPSSTELTDKYRGDIAQAATQLTTDLDAIGHSLHGDPGASTTPTYVRASSASSNPTVERAAVHQGITGESQAPEVTPTKLPEMPRATPAVTAESSSGASTPAIPGAPHPVNPTLANLIGGQAGTTSAASPGGTSAPHTSPNPSTSTHQPAEHHQAPKPTGAPTIPSVPLPDLSNIPLDTITTAVSSAAAHQLPAQAPSAPAPSIPVSTGITPGVPGTSPTAPMTPMTPGLAPIGGGGGLSTPPPVTQPAPPVTPAAPSPAPQQTTPSPPRSPVADVGWIQRTYGLAPGVELPKSDTSLAPALFITDLPEGEAHLHRALATLRQAFESAGWSQPLAVATLRRGFETKAVYVTADAVSIHPQGVLLPDAVTPLDEIASVPVDSHLEGSVMVTDKLTALIPYGWELESMLSTVPADEHHQTAEQYQELVGSGELLDCKVSRGREGVTADEALRVFARAAIGSAGCSDLDVESARLQSARWVGVQPAQYGEVLGRWYLADAAESMSMGCWGEAVYASESYLGLVEPKSQVA